ncbi:hypothetical protein A5624_10550 [Mycobacterium sp. 1482292.6]|nr:hypothetical protein A5624_10550 [Mycobacterium sp. 1482292.6]OBJ24483.1 hypothetical protein A5622_11780 [Mycobacterium sp. 1245801.1]
MELVMLRPVTACCYVATGQLVALTAKVAFLGAERADEAGVQIAIMRAARAGNRCDCAGVKRQLTRPFGNTIGCGPAEHG